MAPRSRIKQMADEEADRVEAEDADADNPAEPEPDEAEQEAEAAPEPEPEHEDNPAELSMEAKAAMFETALQLHHDNMAGLYGDEWADMELCPLCNGVGAVSPDAPVLDPTTMRCERCKGHGQLMTEAVNANNVFRQCPDCVGNGYVPKAETVPTPPLIAAPSYFPESPNVSTATPPPVAIPPMPVFDAQANVWRDPATGVELSAAPLYVQVDGAGSLVAT